MNALKFLKQALIILTISFIGEGFHYWIPLGIPASIYGMVLLFLLLVTGVIKPVMIKETSSMLIALMPILFVPSAVGLMEYWENLKTNLPVYAIMIVVTTMLVMISSGLVTQKIRIYKEKKDE